MTSQTSGLFSSYKDVWVVDGVRTTFAEYNGLLGDVSPTDMGIKVARALSTARAFRLATSAACSPATSPRRASMAS